MERDEPRSVRLVPVRARPAPFSRTLALVRTTSREHPFFHPSRISIAVTRSRTSGPDRSIHGDATPSGISGLRDSDRTDTDSRDLRFGGSWAWCGRAVLGRVYSRPFSRRCDGPRAMGPDCRAGPAQPGGVRRRRRSARGSGGVPGGRGRGVGAREGAVLPPRVGTVRGNATAGFSPEASAV